MRPTAPPVRRPSEIEDPSNLVLVHAVSNRLTPLLARLGVRPNAVSIAGMACGIAAGICYFRCPDRGAILAGFVLMIAWHVLDGTDGQLARLTNSQSETGRILDGICDHLTFAAVYLALALRCASGHGAAVWALVAISGVCHAAQSAAYERQRQDYERWGWGRAAGRAPGRAPNVSGATGTPRSFGHLGTIYDRMQSFAALPASDGARLDGLFRADPAFGARYRATFSGPVRTWSALSANWRTFAIFLFALAGVPLLYFGWEIVVLSGALAVLIRRRNARVARFVAAEARVATWERGP